MSIVLLPLISYALIGTFTPGPNNISSASAAALYGYRNTLRFQAGMSAGVFVAVLLSGVISATLLRAFPVLEPMLRYAGAVYILYLAFSMLKASYNFSDENAKPLGFRHGLVLNLLNPKLIVYAFTLYATFLASITGNVALLALVAVMQMLLCFSAASAWALFGTGIRTYLHDPRLKLAVNVVLALLLVYTAIELSGMLKG